METSCTGSSRQATPSHSTQRLRCVVVFIRVTSYTDFMKKDTFAIILPDLPRATSDFGFVNALGVWTLCKREVQRFCSVALQALVAPVVVAFLFLAVLFLALGDSRGATMMPGNTSFGAFLAPGLIMMTILQNAFANTSSSLITAKIQGTIFDILTPPLAPWELTLGLTAGGVVRGALLGILTAIPMSLFIGLHVHAVPAILFYGLSAALMLSLLGIVGGLLARKFEHIAAITNFIVMPLSFLSGTFYSIERLPDVWQKVALGNPFFHLIDGFRYGFTGHAEGSLLLGAIFVSLCNIALWLLTHQIVVRGWRIKS